MFAIDLETRMLECDNYDIAVCIGDYRILMFSKPLILKNKPFNEKELQCQFLRGGRGLSDIQPFLCGVGLVILEKKGVVEEIAVDYYAHSRYYYSLYGGKLNISDDWRELPHCNTDLNVFQLLYFLNWDSCFCGETFFKELKYFAPTYVYKLFDNGCLQKEYIPFPKMEEISIFEALSTTISALTNVPCGVMLSGGTDSTLIALASKEQNTNFKFLSAHIVDLNMYDNLQDEMGAKMIAKDLGLNFEVVDVKIRDFLSGWNSQLTKGAAFAYKDGRLWQGIAKVAKQKKLDVLINGQNADALYNYSWTGQSEVDIMMRSVTTNSSLYHVFVDNDFSEDLLEKWKANNDAEISPERFLAWTIIKGNGYRNYIGKVVDTSAKRDVREYYDRELSHRLHELIELLKNGQLLSVRHLLMQGKLVGYVDGEDTRCISAACSANGIKSFQLYATPLVFKALMDITLDENDIEEGKRLSKSICSSCDGYVNAQLKELSLSRENTCTASQVWSCVYNILDKEYNLKDCIKTSFDVFKSLNIFEVDKLWELMGIDIGVKLRVAWFGLIYRIYTQSNSFKESTGSL